MSTPLHSILPSSYLEDLKGGVQYLKESRIVKNLCMMGVLANAVIVPINSLQSPIINEVMGQGAELMSAFGVALVAVMWWQYIHLQLSFHFCLDSLQV